MKNCQEVRELLPEFLSNRADEGEKKVVQEHLERCVACREQSVALRETFDTLGSALAPNPPETYWRNFLPRLHDRLSEERRTRPELASWVYRFLVPSAGLLVTILLLGRIGIVPEPNASFLAQRQLVEEMSPREFHQLAESAFDPLFPESSSRLEALLPYDEETGRIINSLIATSSDEVTRVHEANLHGFIDLGLEDLTNEEMEAVIQRLEGNGTL